MQFSFNSQSQDVDMTTDELIRLLRDKFGGKSKSSNTFCLTRHFTGGIYEYLIKSGHLKLPPYDECTLEHLIAIFTGKKAALYSSECNVVTLQKYQELSMERVIPMMKEDPEIWKYMVEQGDRKKPKWNREYALTILASKKPSYVK